MHRGGKVVAVPELPTGEARQRLLERYGDLIESLGGSFVTGPDVNTGETDMDAIGSRTAQGITTDAAAERLAERRLAGLAASL